MQVSTKSFACVEVVYWGFFRAGSVKRLCRRGRGGDVDGERALGAVEA